MHHDPAARGIPKAFWGSLFVYCLELKSHMVLCHSMQEGECGATIISGNMSDILHLADFVIWDWCWALSPTHSNQENKRLCHCLGPSFDLGAELCYVCATAGGKVPSTQALFLCLRSKEQNSDDL